MVGRRWLESVIGNRSVPITPLLPLPTTLPPLHSPTHPPTPSLNLPGHPPPPRYKVISLLSLVMLIKIFEKSLLLIKILREPQQECSLLNKQGS